jgi:hypothetical protein
MLSRLFLEFQIVKNKKAALILFRIRAATQKQIEIIVFLRRMFFKKLCSYNFIF